MVGAACFALLFVIKTEASAAAFFCCSRAIRVFSATSLPAATRFGFFFRCVGAGAGFVACCVISTCECAVCVSPSDCSNGRQSRDGSSTSRHPHSAPEIFPIQHIYAKRISRDGCRKLFVRCSGGLLRPNTVPTRISAQERDENASDIRQTSIFHISEAIQNLLPELREKIYKEYVAIKLRERKEMGWDEVHYVIEEAPFCEKRLRIVNGFFCNECDGACRRNGICSVCYENGDKHYPSLESRGNHKVGPQSGATK